MINIFDSEAELLVELCSFFVLSAKQAIAERNEFNVALSGGNSPKGFYEMLSLPSVRDTIDWSMINFFFGDERYVPADSPENNASMVKEILFNPLSIPAEHIFAIDTSLSPEESAKEYAMTINSHFKGEKVRFDLILLGLGGNAHTASLFPHTSVLKDRSASVKEVILEHQNQYRITMNAPLINQARRIAFLVYGSDKADAVYHTLEGAFNPFQYPAQLIKPVDGHLNWFLDKKAASSLRGR